MCYQGHTYPFYRQQMLYTANKKQKAVHLFNQSHTVYITPLVINALWGHTDTHTHVQAKEISRCAWFKNSESTLAINALRGGHTYQRANKNDFKKPGMCGQRPRAWFKNST